MAPFSFTSSFRFRARWSPRWSPWSRQRIEPKAVEGCGGGASVPVVRPSRSHRHETSAAALRYEPLLELEYEHTRIFSGLLTKEPGGLRRQAARLTASRGDRLDGRGIDVLHCMSRDSTKGPP